MVNALEGELTPPLTPSMRDLLLLKNIRAKYLECIFYQFMLLDIELSWGCLTGFLSETGWCLMPRQILLQNSNNKLFHEDDF